MPRNPQIADLTAEIRGSVFSALAHRLAEHEGEVYPFHVGDTWLAPPPGTRPEELAADGLNRYDSPSGNHRLVDLLVERVRDRTGVPVERANVYPTAGATAGLGCATRVLLDAGDEVLLLAPYWPLIAGIVRAARGVPVPVPLFGGPDGPCLDSEELVERLERAATERTAALYLNTPNNPSGRLLPPSWIEALVAWASRRGLWILADEVYEDLVFRGDHRYAFALAPERTVAAHSFSKAYAMAGNRCGYLVAPAPVREAIEKVGTHTFYSTPTFAQSAAAIALLRGGPWLEATARRYRSAGESAAARLGLDAPDGGTFLFFDVAEALDENGLLGFLEECAEEGLLLAPGPSFGPFETWARLCFTAAPEEVTARGLDVLTHILESRGARLGSRETASRVTP